MRYAAVCHAVTVTNCLFTWFSVVINVIFNTYFNSIICYTGKFYFEDFLKLSFQEWKLWLQDRCFSCKHDLFWFIFTFFHTSSTLCLSPLVFLNNSTSFIQIILFSCFGKNTFAVCQYWFNSLRYSVTSHVNHVHVQFQTDCDTSVLMMRSSSSISEVAVTVCPVFQ
jgi:hypothetical protein